MSKSNWVLWSTWGPRWYYKDGDDGPQVSPFFKSREVALMWYAGQE